MSFVWYIIYYSWLSIDKVTTLFGDGSVLQGCKVITNYPMKFYKCSVKKIMLNVHQRLFLKI